MLNAGSMEAIRGRRLGSEDVAAGPAEGSRLNGQAS